MSEFSEQPEEQESVSCPQCGAPSPRSMSFCSECGAPLAAAKRSAPAATRAQPAAKRARPTANKAQPAVRQARSTAKKGRPAGLASRSLTWPVVLFSLLSTLDIVVTLVTEHPDAEQTLSPRILLTVVILLTGLLAGAKRNLFSWLTVLASACLFLLQLGTLAAFFVKIADGRYLPEGTLPVLITLVPSLLLALRTAWIAARR